MLENAKAFSGFAVDDIERAQRFYGGTLGLRTSEDNGLLILHLAGTRSSIRSPTTRRRPTRSSTFRSTTSMRQSTSSESAE
jgi:catechol 2,3-dioxygenase-like lactoylglutathione lyase family enzyme